jgi:hypothetical protein
MSIPYEPKGNCTGCSKKDTGIYYNIGKTTEGLCWTCVQNSRDSAISGFLRTIGDPGTRVGDSDVNACITTGHLIQWRDHHIVLQCDGVWIYIPGYNYNLLRNVLIKKETSCNLGIKGSCSLTVYNFGDSNIGFIVTFENEYFRIANQFNAQTSEKIRNVLLKITEPQK